jgi:large subunit ribosomal protein L6
MSRIGRIPVAVPPGVTVSVTGGGVMVKGPKGELRCGILPEVSVQVEESPNQVVVQRKEDTNEARARHGLTRQLIKNMVVGVSQGYEKQLEIIGVGYKAQAKGKTVTLHLGFSHPVDYPVAPGIEIAQDEKNKNILIIRGIDKQLVGQVAADIRSLRPPEPYKGKGIRYVGEEVRRKPGKAAVKAAGAPAA